jgi:protein required for attachment to host cells
MKATRTWFLVADGARARIVETTGSNKEVRMVDLGQLEAESRPSRELGSDRPGRVSESVGQQRHAIEPRKDPHRGLETLFAHQLVDILDERLASKSFDRLVLVAPPVMLGDLRKALSEALRAVVAAEVAKDLTKVATNELMRHLERDLTF